MNIGILASHNGTNAQAVIDAFKQGKTKAKVTVIISNNSNAGVLERARKENIPWYHLSLKTHPDPNALDEIILETLIQHNVELVLLAGYMKKLGTKTLTHFKNRIINIHPALLPAYGGAGMYGLNVHKEIIKNKEKETGITIHMVNEEYDDGRIINQMRIPVKPEDTPENLQKRVLDHEHLFLVDTLNTIINKHPVKKYPTIAVCGLECGMCPRYYTEGPSRCPGCAGPGFFDKHPPCSFITCCVKKKRLEVCAECPDFPCAKFKSEEEYDKLEGSSSYPPYKNVFPNLKYIKEHGILKFIERQKEKLELLSILLRNYNDGRSRSFFCRAVSFLETSGLRDSLHKAGHRIKAEKISKTDIKTRAKIMKTILIETAAIQGVDLG
ncbi:MAG: phosphoribosylglycinamide formyltransferase [Spirochaetia bacterium]